MTNSESSESSESDDEASRKAAEKEAIEASKKAQCLGRSKGGLSCKIHALCDAKGRPVALMLTPGQANDLHGFDGLSDKIKSDVLIADKGYDADKRVREVLKAAGKTAVIPPRRNRKTPATYDKEMYKKRHKIENCFSRLKDFRGIATRYDKTKRNFLAGVQLAAAVVWMTEKEPAK